MQATEFHFVLIEHLLDPWHQRNPDPVAEFDPVEPKIDNLAQHLSTVSVPA
jgi:hypothetical protein